MKRQIFFADLTHTAQGISAATFPLGASYVMAYARQELGAEFDFRLFKFPDVFEQALLRDSPSLLAFSHYSWNSELACKMAELAKARQPGLVVVFGGPNFPTDADEKAQFLGRHRAVDFYVELEGELGFVDLVRSLDASAFDPSALKASGVAPLNTTYLRGEQLVSGPQRRIDDINVIPSPYLTGVLDEFFDLPLVPMVETTRGCPFACTFCADGLAIKNRVSRFKADRTREELSYIAARVKNIDELIITDLNFAMYAGDVETARMLSDLRRTHNWPTLLSASAGKNKPHRTIEVASILGGAWTLGASIQSTDAGVLRSIKRSNISSAAYQKLIEYGNTLETSKTHSEVILALPGDSKSKHFESLRFGVENNVNSLRMFQAILLVGTEMASRATRTAFGLLTRFRTIPGCVGIYEFFGQKHSVAEIEEIIVGSQSLPFEDYLECRVMNLIVETFHNNALFEEVFALVRALGASAFDCLLRMKEHLEDAEPTLRQIVAEFRRQTTINLFDSYDQARAFVLTPSVIEKYIGGEMGINELLVHRALLYREFDGICRVLFDAVRATLHPRGLLTEQVGAYLDELQRFTILRKKGIFDDQDTVKTGEFRTDFEAVKNARYRIDPNQWTGVRPPRTLYFFHDGQQKHHIANQMRIYARTPIGLGRLIQRSNLKMMYRSFSPSPPAK